MVSTKTLNTYFVYVRDEKENKPEMRTENWYWLDDDPPEEVWCADIIEAESPAQAKHTFLREWTRATRSPVCSDDWPNLRVRKLGAGILTEKEAWWRIHEILDHAGAPCDCPEVDFAE